MLAWIESFAYSLAGSRSPDAGQSRKFEARSGEYEMSRLLKFVIPSLTCAGRLTGLTAILLVWGGGPLTSQEPSSRAAAEFPVEGLKHYVERSVSGPGGEYLIAGGVSRGYLMDSRKLYLARKISAHHDARGGDLSRLVIVLYDAYNSQVLAADGEDHDLGTGELQHLTRFLHQECYKKFDYETDDVFQAQRANVACYIDRIADFLSGDTIGFRAYLVWGTRLEDIRYWDPIVVPTLILTLLGMTLPPMAIFLLIVWALRDTIRNQLLAQRLVKVLGPLAIGMAWFVFWLYLAQSAGIFPGVLNSIKTWFWLSGLFFALNFIACMWLADHLFFPENYPPPLWVVGLFYLFGPFLLVLGGAAGSAAGQGAAAAAGGSGGGRSTSSGGNIAGGGGTFGGGGASGSF